MPPFRPHVRRVVALFGAGVLAIGRFWVEAVADHAISSRWPLVPLALAGLVGVGAAAFAVFVSITPYARQERIPMVRWGAAAAMLFSISFLASRLENASGGFIVGATLLAACLCAWRAERLGRAAAPISHADV